VIYTVRCTTKCTTRGVVHCCYGCTAMTYSHSHHGHWQVATVIIEILHQLY